MYDDLRKVMLDDERSKSGKESLINERFDAIKKNIYIYIKQCDNNIKEDVDFIKIQKEKNEFEIKEELITLSFIVVNIIIGYFIYNGINSSISNNNLIFTVFMVFINIILTAIIFDVRNKKTKKKKKYKELKDDYISKKNERIDLLGSGIFNLSSNQIKSVKVMSNVMVKNDLLRSLVLKDSEMVLEKLSLGDFIKNKNNINENEIDDSVKYKLCELFISINWTVEAKIVFLFEYFKESN